MSRFRLTRRPVGSFDLQFTDFVILAHIIIFQYIIYVARSFFVMIFISIKKISKSFVNEQAQCVCVWTLLNHRIAYNLAGWQLCCLGMAWGLAVNVCIIFPSSLAGQLARMRNFQCHFSEKSENLKLVPDNMYRI